MSTDAVRPITKRQVARLLRGIIRDSPDSRNPRRGTTCVYHQGRGRNIHRCLIGELGWRLGLPTPPGSTTDSVSRLASRHGPWDDLLTPRVISGLRKVQTAADQTEWVDVEGLTVIRSRRWDHPEIVGVVRQEFPST